MTGAAIFRERLKELLELGKLTSKEIYFILNLMQQERYYRIRWIAVALLAFLSFQKSA